MCVRLSGAEDDVQARVRVNHARNLTHLQRVGAILLVYQCNRCRRGPKKKNREGRGESEEQEEQEQDDDGGRKAFFS